MATTYYKSRNITKGKTKLQTMKDGFDYGQNPLKTRNGELIKSYMCDHETAYAEFALSKAQYKAITGREQKKDKDVLYYHKRQAFLPGEIDHDGALEIGYETAMRWTKGKHAFFVVSHIDRPHLHVHIYYNSTTLDCTRKFRDFLGSARAFRRLSDRICLEHNLSVVTDPKLHSKGQYKHYGQWIGPDKPPAFQERLKVAIDACLAEHPKDFDAFLAAMAAAGYEHKYGRGGVLSFKTDGQKNYTRLRASTLGDGYSQDDILAIIEGRAALPASRGQAVHAGGTLPAGSPRKVNLIIDIQERMRAGKGPAYQQWAKIYNLKMMAAALQYLQENDLLEYAQLEKQAARTVDRFHELAGQIQKTEAAIKRNGELRSAVVDYARTRPVFEEYKAKKYSSKYLAEHEADIAAYRAAQSAMRELLDGERLPKMDALKAEAGRLTAEKKSLYSQYRAAQKEMREIVAVKGNVDHLLGLTGGRKNKEQER